MRPTIEALVTNINTGGEWVVVLTTTSRHGPFDDRADAERFAEAVRGRSVKRAECGRLLVGQGGDTYDPTCVLPTGHSGRCRPFRALHGSERSSDA